MFIQRLFIFFQPERMMVAEIHMVPHQEQDIRLPVLIEVTFDHLSCFPVVIECLLTVDRDCPVSDLEMVFLSFSGNIQLPVIPDDP